MSLNIPHPYLDTLINWVDSFLTLDRQLDQPASWSLTRILAHTFIARIQNIPTPSGRLVAEANHPQLFQYVLTLTLLNFFEYYASSNDPDWLKEILFQFRRADNDVHATEHFVDGRYSHGDLLALDQSLLSINPPLDERLCARETFQPDVPILPIAPTDPQFQLNYHENHYYPNNPAAMYIPIPLPNIPTVRITPQSIDIQRNSMVQLATDGTTIYTYDQPPPVLQNLELQQQVAFLTNTLMTFVHQRDAQPLPSSRSPRDRFVFITPDREVTMSSPPASPRLASSATRPLSPRSLASSSSTSSSLNSKFARLTTMSGKNNPTYAQQTSASRRRSDEKTRPSNKAEEQASAQASASGLTPQPIKPEAQPAVGGSPTDSPPGESSAPIEPAITTDIATVTTQKLAQLQALKDENKRSEQALSASEAQEMTYLQELEELIAEEKRRAEDIRERMTQSQEGLKTLSRERESIQDKGKRPVSLTARQANPEVPETISKLIDLLQQQAPDALHLLQNGNQPRSDAPHGSRFTEHPAFDAPHGSRSRLDASAFDAPHGSRSPHDAPLGSRAYTPNPPTRPVRQVYVGRMATPAYEPNPIPNNSTTVIAPHDWPPLFPYEPVLNRHGTRRYNERYDARRIPIFNEKEIPCDTWLSQLNVEVVANGEEAVCPLIGRTAFPQGSQLYRWFNNLPPHDLMSLSLGPNAWHNWQYAIYTMRDRLQPLIRHQAEARKKQTDESYHSYITSRYPLLKAAMPYAPENEIISKIKEAFTEDLAFSIMNEENDIQKLENQALRYERMTEIRQRHQSVLPSSYLKMQTTPMDLDTNMSDSTSLALNGRRYSQTPRRSGPTANTSDYVRPQDLDPKMLVGRRSTAVNVDPRAHTVNFRECKELGRSIRSYVRDGPNASIIFMDRNCSVCERKDLHPRDHFKFEHNLYHDDLAESKTHAYWSSLPQQFQGSDSESDTDFQ